MTKCKKISVFIVLISLLLPLWVNSAPVCNAGSKTMVKVGYFENELFQEGAEEDTVKSGYAYEYYRKLSEYTGWEYEYIYGSFSDLYQMLLDGEIDLLAGLAKNEERTGIIGYPERAMGSETYNMVSHSDDDSITISPDTLNGKRIGVLDSAMVGVLNEFLETKEIEAEVVAFPEYGSLFQAFDHRDVDAFVAESDGAANRENASLLYAFGSSDYFLCVTKGRSDLLEELNDAQEELINEEPNYINSLRMKYYSQSISSRALSSDEKQWISENNSIRVGYLKNYLPYSDEDRDGNATGLLIDLFPEIIHEVGIGDMKISYVGYDSYDEMIKDVNEETIDVAFPVGGGLYFSEENGIYQSNAVISSGTELIYAGEYSEEKTKSFAINENNRMQYYYVNTNFPEAEITYYSSIDDCLEAVLDGTVGATTLNGIRANDILKNRKYRGLFFKQLSKNDDRCFGVRIGNEGLLKIINRGISIVGEDRAQVLAYKYVDGLYHYSLWDLFNDYLWLVLLVIAVIAVLIVLILQREFAAAKTAANLAEQANRAKSYFLSSISHDIRTPMNSILSMNEMVLRESKDEEILTYANHIRSSGNTLLGLINDILDLSKLEAGKLDIIPINYDVSSLLNDLVTMVESLASEKGLRLELDIDPTIPNFLYGDEVHIKQAATNILTNAVKYTPKGMVSFSVHSKRIPGDDTSVLLHFIVKDTGVGIKQENMDRLFLAFERIEEDENKNIEGTGLGLTITERILNMMDSSLQVESEYKKGSVFSFTIRQNVNRWDEVGNLEEAFRHSMTERKRYKEKFTAPQASVLVVDDTPVNLTVIKSLLKRTKLKIDLANSGDEGIEYARRKKYDMIFLDHMMPDKDGIETLKELKEMPDNLNRLTPTICLTANAIQGMREIYLNAGFDDYITKPINPDHFEDMILRYLPDEKILPPEEKEETWVELPKELERVEALDISAGLEHCGNEEAYLDALEAYLETGEASAKEIEQLFHKNDFEAVTTKVHGLKSTSLAIGATELSELAKKMEMAGKAGETDVIKAHMEELLASYRKLIKDISFLSDATAPGEEKPMLSKEELLSAYKELKELCKESDYGAMEELGEKLSEYRVPQEEEENVSKILKALSDLEYEEVEQYLK